jgi:hypothetical protein
MGNSKVIIAIVVTIIIVKILAVHYYVKSKIKESEEKSDDK